MSLSCKEGVHCMIACGWKIPLKKYNNWVLISLFPSPKLLSDHSSWMVIIKMNDPTLHGFCHWTLMCSELLHQLLMTNYEIVVAVPKLWCWSQIQIWKIRIFFPARYVWHNIGNIYLNHWESKIAGYKMFWT